MTRLVSAASLRSRLIGSDEFALLDAREQGVHCRGHPFFACSLPLSRLEMMVEDLVPRRSVPLVLLDGGGEEDLAVRAAGRLRELGYSKVEILEGGCAAWQASGGELFSGVNVPSKAFGEFVEHRYDTPRIAPEALKRLQESGEKLVILDSRPYEEYHRMSVPGGIDAPGAELAYRVHDLAPDPDTLVVVNCAGRTRSIIGCQSLRNAGIPNPVVALKDGTMGWELAGHASARGATSVAPAPTRSGLAKARAAADRVARRFGVRFASLAQVEVWRSDPQRTLYLLDVRTREEFEERRIAGSRHAPGGQLVQATDEYVGVHNARVVLIDPARVRSVMTASWLVQMGWNEVFVLEPEGEDGFSGGQTESGPRKRPVAGFRQWETVGAPEVLRSAMTIVDLSSSLRYRDFHISGAWWAVRSRLAEARARVGPATDLVLTSEDGVLAHLAAGEAASLWPDARVRVLDGGNSAWRGAGHGGESGIERATTTLDDVWYKPYDHGAETEKHAREYLTWEVGLVDQIKREPSIRFRAFD